MLKNAFKKHPLQNRTNVQIKGGGVKGLLNNVQKTALFLADGFPNKVFNCYFTGFCTTCLAFLWLSSEPGVLFG